MEIKKLIVGQLQTNCYIVSEKGSSETMLIDPGAEGNRIADACLQLEINPVLVVNTHAHYDHIGANAALKRRFPALRFAAGELDADAVTDPVMNLSAGFGVSETMPSPDIRLKDGDRTGLPECEFRVHHTPGHTRGGISLVSTDASPPVVFCGDLIFAEGVGRTDLPGGSAAKLRESIHNLLLACPDCSVLYPGHGPATTVGEQKQLYLAKPEQFI